MKKLILVNGTMGAGKTTTCTLLLKKLHSAVFLDGDWCWNMNPFVVNDETKAMALNNIVFLLNSFLGCSEYRYVIFCWVMHEEKIIDDIVARLVLEDVSVYRVTLAVSESALIGRLEKDVAEGLRDADSVARSLARRAMYESMNTVKIDASEKTPVWAAEEIKKLIGC